MPPVNAAQASLFDNMNPLPPWPVANDTGDVEIVIDATNPTGQPRLDPASGAMEIPLPNGAVIIDLNPYLGDDDEDEGSDFDKNLAEKLGVVELSRIANDLLQGIEEDEDSRSQWLEDRAKGLELLGLKLEQTKGSVGATSAPLEGMSTVRHPLLLEAVLRAQANAYGELCPAAGPAKVVNYGQETSQEDGLAEALESDFNFYLTNIAKEYYPSYRSMLFHVMFAGMGFRKVYRCPLRRRPVSETVDAEDLIVNNTATDLHNAARVTHKVTMRKSLMKRMQWLKVYRRVALTDPTPDYNEVDRKVANIQGIDINTLRPEDEEYTLYECYCELDLPGYEHKEGGEPTGLPLPYRVTIEKNSRQVLEIRRNWDEDQEDEDFLAKIPFVPFTYVSGLGFYGIGLLHILGNTTNAVTVAWREMLDAGMFANFPGFLIAQEGSRQQTNEMRVPPGAGMPVKINGGTRIQDAIMPLPYKEAGPSMMALVENIASTGQRVGGTAEMPVGEGKQDAPVGTTLALIEQATKIESTVHKGLHASQDEEFRLLKDLFREDPAALWRKNKRCALRRDRDKTLVALEDCDLVPRADPNVPSRMHRLAKIAAVKQLQAQNPMLYDAKAVDSWALPQLGVDDPESFFAPPMENQPDPIKMQELMIKAKQASTAEFKAVSDAQNKVADRKSRENVAVLNLADRIASNPGALPEVQTVLHRVP